MERAESGADLRGPEMQEESRKTERAAGPWAKQNSQHGLPLQAIPQEVRQRLGGQEYTWVVKRRVEISAKQELPSVSTGTRQHG